MKESGNHDEIVGEYNVNFGRENNPPSYRGPVHICTYFAYANKYDNMKYVSNIFKYFQQKRLLNSRAYVARQFG